MPAVTAGVINKKSLLYATTLIFLFSVFCAFHATSNTSPFAYINHFSRNADGVEQGCYLMRSASKKILLDEEKLKQRQCNKTLPYAIIVGAKKCGTTALRNFLAFHPQIASARDEIHFFENRYYLGLDWYLDQMPYSTPGQITLEKTPRYFVHPLSARAIRHHLGPDIKLILILRDPKNRAISDFVHVLESRAIKLQSEQPKPATFPDENTLAGDQKFILQYLKNLSVVPAKIGNTFEETVFHKNGSVNTRTSIIDTGIYSKYLKKWLKVFSPSNFLILDGEEFVYNPLPALHKVEKFLNLPQYFTHDSFYFDMEKKFFCLAQPIRSCLRAVKGRGHSYVSQETMQKLQEFYHPYNVELMQMMKLNFTWLPNVD